MLSRALRSETVKFAHRRTTLLLLISVALLPPLLATSFTLMLRGGDQFASPWLQSTLSSQQDLLLIVFDVSDLFCVLAGVLAITSEYRSLTIMRTYQVFPGRYTVLMGKLLVLALLVFVASTLAVGLALVVLMTPGGGVPVPQPPGLLAAGFVFNGFVVALFGYGVGLVLSRTLPTLLTVVAFMYVLPDTVRVFCSVFLPDLVDLYLYLPTEASGAIMQSALRGGSYAGIHPAHAAIVSVVETATVLALGMWIQRRRDIL